MTKHILSQYMDLQQEIQEVRERIRKTEREIAKIEEEGAVVDSVRGGEGGIQHFRIEGFPYPEYSWKRTVLLKRKALMEELEQQDIETLEEIHRFLKNVTDRNVRRIITLRFIDKLTWEQVAKNMGEGYSASAVKMVLQRFLAKTEKCDTCDD